MAEVLIRRLNILDFPDFKDLCDESEWYYPQVCLTPQALLKYELYRNNCFVAYDGNTLVGYIYGGVLCDTLYPQFAFVREIYRKRGIGRKLMEALEQNANCSVSMIYYHKSLSNHYKKQGYEIGTALEVAIKQFNGEVL